MCINVEKTQLCAVIFPSCVFFCSQRSNFFVTLYAITAALTEFISVEYPSFTLSRLPIDKSLFLQKNTTRNDSFKPHQWKECRSIAASQISFFFFLSLSFIRAISFLGSRAHIKELAVSNVKRDYYLSSGICWGRRAFILN